MSQIPGARYGLYTARDFVFRTSTVAAKQARIGFYSGWPLGRVHEDDPHLLARVQWYMTMNPGYIHLRDGTTWIEGTSCFRYLNSGHGTALSHNCRILSSGTIVATVSRIPADTELLAPYGADFWRQPHSGGGAAGVNAADAPGSSAEFPVAID